MSTFAKFVADSLPLEPMHHARLFHATGITLALGEDCRDLLSIAREHASSRGARTSFDLNFRSRLWSMADAKSYSESWVSQSDLVFMAKRDACAWLGCSASDRDEEVLRALSRGREGRCTVMTLGPRGAIALEKDQLVAAATVEVAGVGRLGGGDSFSAGFIYGWLQGWDLATNLRWGNATAGLKHSIPGDMPLITRSEIERIVAEPIVRGVDR
jgi:2-dehydro-3-deoxygluconokinase